VADLERALADLELESVHAAVRGLEPGAVAAVAARLGSGAPADRMLARRLAALEAGLRTTLEAVTAVTGAPGDPRLAAALTTTRLRAAVEHAPATATLRRDLADPTSRAAILGWLLAGALGGRTIAAQRFERLALTGPLAAALRSAVPDDVAAWNATEAARRLLAADEPAAARRRRSLEAWLRGRGRAAGVRRAGSRGAAGATAASRSR
jgi:hypothetical protein